MENENYFTNIIVYKQQAADSCDYLKKKFTIICFILQSTIILHKYIHAAPKGFYVYYVNISTLSVTFLV